jgi:hypothetical protein
MPAESITPLLERADVAQESFVLRWLDANLSQLQAGDPAILARRRTLPCDSRARSAAAQRNRNRLALALRPDGKRASAAFSTGRAWFETNTQHDVADLALALCDSPEADVRAYGREFLQARGEQVLNADVLKKLGENSIRQCRRGWPNNYFAMGRMSTQPLLIALFCARVVAHVALKKR